MNAYITRVEVKGLFGRMDLTVDLCPGVNILYGRNGSGKTTLLHIIANVVSGSFSRFSHIQFCCISISTSNGHVLRISSAPSDDEGESDFSVKLDNEHIYTHPRRPRRSVPARPGLPGEEPVAEIDDERAVKHRDWLGLGGVVYFPAFRSTIEAWSDRLMRGLPSGPGSRHRSKHSRYIDMTKRIRGMFGEFVPIISYPSPIEIAEDLGNRIQYTQFSVARRGQEILSNAFVQAFAALSSPDLPTEATSESILGEIGELLDRLDDSVLIEDRETKYRDTYTRLKDVVPSLSKLKLGGSARNVLAVYRDSLATMVEEHEQAYRPIRDYIDAVNGFLEDKHLVPRYRELVPRRVTVAVEFEDGSVADLGSLSSGEKQIASMMYAATYFGDLGSIVLIDEPEISLHIDWQRRFVPTIAERLGDHQLIICTHSPEIGLESECNYQPMPVSPSGAQNAHVHDEGCWTDEGGYE